MPTIDNPPLSPPPPFPKLGQTRCYWALLSAELEYLYIDPVLSSHLGPQADAIIGKKLLEFVHPDEHASAQQDLGKVLESRTLHGSVTRVRYSRLGPARARLGFTGVHENFADEDKVSFDENYMACDLVINWAAEGLVLCFIHAVVDMSPQDNDELRITHWTNWCGTPRMNAEHGAELYHALFHVAPHAAQGAPPPTRVFQILHNSTDRPTLFSWPAEGYTPADYGRLANDVQIGGANGSDAKTSCTRRYKAQQILNSTDGSVRDVESIFIPHGHIIFACHKATPHRPRGHPNSYPLYPTPAQFYEAPHPPSYYPPLSVPSQLDPYTAYPHPPHHQHASPIPSSGPSSPRGGGTHSPYPPPPPTQPQQQWAAQPQQPYVEHHPPSNGHRYAPAAGAFMDEVPPPRQRAGRLSPESGGAGGSGSGSAGGGSTRETYQGGGRAGGNPPVGVSRCAACKSTSSPEWRKGPSGRKDLCNACGLRYSRARAKKEGVAVQRRRKEGGNAGAGASTKMAVAPPSRRRAYTHNGYGDFGMEQHQRLGDASTVTPSPSPPHDYPPPPPPPPPSHHAPSPSGVYTYAPPVDPRQGGMYAMGAHSYSAQQQQQQNGYLATPRPASPAVGSTSVSSSTASSYERTEVENQHAHVPP